VSDLLAGALTVLVLALVAFSVERYMQGPPTA